ncbi:MAG: hypothetical protein M3115_04920 [Thermoproteota archaeon]|nr:hypothetical protein [Thermoproteota archaeon]
MSDKIESSSAGAADRIVVVNDLEGVTFGGKVGLSRNGFNVNVNTITNLKRTSSNYEMRKYDMIIDTKLRVSHNFNLVGGRNSGGIY